MKTKLAATYHKALLNISLYLSVRFQTNIGLFKSYMYHHAKYKALDPVGIEAWRINILKKANIL